MINVAIVEDEIHHSNIIRDYLLKFGNEHYVQFKITAFSDGLDITEDYDGSFDLVFLDIQMKHLDGMTAAQRIRAMDSEVELIFVTSTVQYAVQGYAVDALGYVLKPVPYVAFSQLVEKAKNRIEAKKKKNYIRVPVGDTQVKMDCDKITFVESRRNNVIIHTLDEEYVTAGPLKKYEEVLGPFGFSKCHNEYIVNLSSVQAVRREEVVVAGNVILPVSRARKKEFMAELTEGIG